MYELEPVLSYPPTVHYYPPGQYRWIPQNKIICLKAEAEINDIIHMNPAAVEVYTREKLALQLATLLLEEDLICFQTDHEIEHDKINVHATINIIQE